MKDKFKLQNIFWAAEPLPIFDMLSKEKVQDTVTS